MLDFAESEIVIPGGRFAGYRFSSQRQPFTRLWLNLVASGDFHEFNTTGAVQSGKTILAFVIPILYYLFERAENVIVGIPRLKDAMRKWGNDILPVLDRTRYKDLKPSYGSGSKRGEFTDIRFKNGAGLIFMSGHGNDEERSGATARVVVITESDKMDEPGVVSREASPINQLIARTESYGEDRVVFKECTISISRGDMWRSIKRGTETRIVCRCPHCGGWVSPGRDDLVGWKDGETDRDAGRRTSWHCPACRAKISESERREMNEGAVAVHRGQDVKPDGSVVGDPPDTRNLGFRWSAFNNLFHTARHLGAVEWKYAREADRDSAERYIHQFIYALPYDGEILDLTALDPEGVSTRTVPYPRGIAPADTVLITVGMDVAKRAIHWVSIAWRRNDKGEISAHILDYDVVKPRWEFLGVEIASLEALNAIADRLDAGFGMVGSTGKIRPKQVWVDSGWQGGKTVDADFVYEFCERRGGRYQPLKGRGVGQQDPSPYSEPKRRDKMIARKGDGWHISRIQKRGVTMWLVIHNADYWKSFIHARLATPVGKPGALTLFDARSPNFHLGLAQQLTSERLERIPDPIKGDRFRWYHESGDNHWLDAAGYAGSAGNYCGIALIGSVDDQNDDAASADHEYFDKTNRGGL